MDGTDDAQIIVTVRDKDGRALNNCPPVTLTIASGPGEFPTGPSITFAPDSDIAIRDGAAAMEFRSYYAGKTIIRATSPGLKDSTVEITSLAGPKFIAGTTPPVKPRPYARFTGTTTISLVTLGRENPTRASSEAAGHSGRLANDGDPATFWQADAGDRNPWLRVDLERVITISKSRLEFPSEGNWRYKLEVSDDGEHDWKLLADQTTNSDTSKERSDVARNLSLRGRFLRVTVVSAPVGQPPCLSELEVTGTLSTQ